MSESDNKGLPQVGTRELRQFALRAFERHFGVQVPHRLPRHQLFHSEDKSWRVYLATFGKKGGNNYWYDFTENGLKFLRAHPKNSYLLCAHGLTEMAYAIPYEVFRHYQDFLLENSGKKRRRAVLNFKGDPASGEVVWRIDKTGERIALKEYEIPLAMEDRSGEVLQAAESDVTPYAGRRGPEPSIENIGYAVQRDAKRAAYTYAFRFDNMDIWKIGWAHDVQKRCADVNAHIPSELLEEIDCALTPADAVWKRYKQCRWPTAHEAWHMEQTLLDEFRSNIRERVRCTEPEFNHAWTRVSARLGA